MRIWLSSIFILLCGTNQVALAQNESPPPAKRLTIDWKTVGRDAAAASPILESETGLRISSERKGRAADQFNSYTEREGTLALARLNEITSEAFVDVGKSQVPVLLPFNAAKFVNDRASHGLSPKEAKAKAADGYVASKGSGEASLIVGPSGYDAFIPVSFGLAIPELKIKARRDVTVQISASAFTHDSEGEKGGEPIEELHRLYPGIRRFVTESDISYEFKKYGVPYTVTVPCSEEAPRGATLSCDAAGKVAGYVISKLQLVGGAPLPAPPEVKSPNRSGDAGKAIAPDKCANAFEQVFTYFAPGKLVHGTDPKGEGGVTSRTVYSDTLRFPIAECPAFANSQVFMHWGDCLKHAKQLPAPKPGEPDFNDPYKQFGRYTCSQNGKRLWHFEGYPENYSYPWRDNFCEDRGGVKTAACPGGLGHQGQDIRPAKCDPKGERCKPGLFDVVAAEDGFLHTEKDDKLNQMTLTVDKGNGDKIYFLYFHTTRDSQISNGLAPGKTFAVKKGQILAKVGNFYEITNGTATHLHFEIRWPKRSTPASPYMTLVRAYERLIGRQGTEIKEISKN